MVRVDIKALLLFVAAVTFGALIAVAGSWGGAVGALGLPVFAWCVGLAFTLQWIAFAPAFVYQTERYYDLIGSLTYISTASLALLSSPLTSRGVLLWALVVIWATRLGTFLFTRVRRAGKDDRFDTIKPSLPRFLSAWTVQGLWVSLTSAAALAGITASAESDWWPDGAGSAGDVDAFLVTGLIVWLVGFAIEVVADAQKSRFRQDPANRSHFIRTGLWAWSRHPNYFGETVLWTGVALIAVPTLEGWRYAVLVSPVFVALLLTRGSGIPLLERKADATWGGQSDYESYKASTPVFFPRPPRRR